MSFKIISDILKKKNGVVVMYNTAKVKYFFHITNTSLYNFFQKTDVLKLNANEIPPDIIFFARNELQND